MERYFFKLTCGFNATSRVPKTRNVGISSFESFVTSLGNVAGRTEVDLTAWNKKRFDGLND